MSIAPCDNIEQAKHAAPSTRAGLAEVWEVLEVVRCDVAVDGEFTVSG